MKAQFRVIVFFVIVHLLSSCGVSAEEYSILRAKNEELQSELVSLNNALVNADNEIENLTENINVLEQEKDDHEKLIEEFQEKSNELEELNKELKEEKSSLQVEKRELESQLTFFICDESIVDMKYETILNVSDILSGWLAKQSYVVRTNYTYRDTIWNNTDTKIHSVQYLHSDGEIYVDHFLVYFDEFGWTEGVFWLSGQCWLTKE